MNRLHTFLSISALSLASSINIAAAVNKEFTTNTKVNPSSTMVESQQKDSRPADSILNPDASKK